MDQTTRRASPASGCLSQLGLAVLVAGATVSILMVTALLPPWVKVRCQKQAGLYFFSHEMEVYEKDFAGFDFVFSPAKLAPGPNKPAGAVFVVTEFRIFWSLLFGEWVVILIAGAYVFVVLSRRLRPAKEEWPKE